MFCSGLKVLPSCVALHFRYQNCSSLTDGQLRHFNLFRLSHFQGEPLKHPSQEVYIKFDAR